MSAAHRVVADPRWRGWTESNRRMPESNSGALTAWRHPYMERRECNEHPRRTHPYASSCVASTSCSPHIFQQPPMISSGDGVYCHRQATFSVWSAYIPPSTRRTVIFVVGFCDRQGFTPCMTTFVSVPPNTGAVAYRVVSTYSTTIAMIILPIYPGFVNRSGLQFAFSAVRFLHPSVRRLNR